MDSTDCRTCPVTFVWIQRTLLCHLTGATPALRGRSTPLKHRSHPHAALLTLTLSYRRTNDYYACSWNYCSHSHQFFFRIRVWRTEHFLAIPKQCQADVCFYRATIADGFIRAIMFRIQPDFKQNSLSHPPVHKRPIVIVWWKNLRIKDITSLICIYITSINTLLNLYKIINCHC